MLFKRFGTRPVLKSFVAVVAAVAIGLLAVTDVTVIGATIAGVALVLLGLEVPVYLVLLLFAGRFRTFPYAQLLPEWVHASFLAATVLIIVVTVRLARDRIRPRALSDSWLPVLFMLAFLAWILVAWLLGGAQPDYAWAKTIDVILFSTILFVVPVVAFQQERDLSRTLLSMVAVSLVLALGALVSSDGSRLAAFGGGPNVFSRFTGIGAIICLHWLNSKGLKWKSAVAGSLLLFVVATVLSGSRGSMLSLGVVLGGYGVFTAARRRSLRVLVGVMLAGVVGLGVLASNEVAASRLLLLLQLDKGESITARQDYANVSLSMAQEKPLTGWGPGAFASAIGTPGIKDYPHNVFLELGSEYGLIGLFLFSGMVLVCLRRLLRTPNPYAPLVTSLLLFSLLVAQASGDLFDSRLIWFFCGLGTSLVSISPSVGRSDRRDIALASL